MSGPWVKGVWDGCLTVFGPMGERGIGDGCVYKYCEPWVKRDRDG